MKRSLSNSPFMFAFGMLAMMIPSQAFSTFYSYYYVEKLGLGLGLVTIARTIFLIWDAVNNPLLGHLSDSTRTRWGRRKPWIYGAMPLFMLMFIMVFAAPDGLGQIGLFVWLLVAIILYEGAASIIWVNYGALFPELFRGDQLRAKASAVQNAFQIVALVIATAVTPILYTSLGFSQMAIIYTAAFAIFMMLCMHSVKEDPEASRSEPLKMYDAFKETLKNKQFWIFNIANSFAQTVNGLLSSMIPFYAKYSLQIPEAQVSILLGSIFISIIPLVAIWYWIIRKFGGLRSWRIGMIAYAICVIPLWFAQGLVGGIAAGIIFGFGMAGFLVTPAVITGQIIDRDAELTGRRREGIYNAVGGFITRSSGLISALAFWIVGMQFGYVSGDNPGSDPDTTFRVLISLVPLILLIIAYVISIFVNLANAREERKTYSI